MSRTNKFKMGDLVLIAGSKETGSGIFQTGQCIGRVECCGLFDSFVKISPTDKMIKVSNKRCNVIDETIECISESVRNPKIGDLVLSYYEKFREVEQRIGVLMEIIDVPGKTKMSKILVETEDVLVPFSALITLEEK